jgi:hypothetical protein
VDTITNPVQINQLILPRAYRQGRINVPRGPWHIISAGPLDPLTPPNGILDSEMSKIKKYPFVFRALKSFLCIYKKNNYTSII